MSSSAANQPVPQPQVKTAYVIGMSIEEFQSTIKDLYHTVCYEDASSSEPESNIMLYQSHTDRGMMSALAFGYKCLYGYHKRVAVGSCEVSSLIGLGSCGRVETSKLPLCPDGERKAFIWYGDVENIYSWGKKLPSTGSVYFIWVTADGVDGEFCVQCIPSKSKKPVEPFVTHMTTFIPKDKWVPYYNRNFNLGRDARAAASNCQFIHTFGTFSMYSNVIDWIANITGNMGLMALKYIFFGKGSKCYTATRDTEIWFELAQPADMRG